MDLKATSIEAVLRIHESLFDETGNPRYVWDAWHIARRMKVSIPDWVLDFVDRLATAEIAKRSRHIDTAERYAAALTEMEVVATAHRNRLRISDVVKQVGVDVTISRRDRPNLSAIARAAAKANGVSVGRLLARYRAGVKAAARTRKNRTPKS